MPKLWAKGLSAAHAYACEQLSRSGFSIIDTPDDTTQGVLLDIPSFRTPDVNPETIWAALPDNAIIIGGNLAGKVPERFRVMDLLMDEEYTAKNADITARCALRLGAEQMNRTYRDMPVLILGWGRIGKCLARLLRVLDAQVCVYARNPADRAMLKTLGYDAISEEELAASLPCFRQIYNTVPAPVLSHAMTAKCRDCLLIDLASQLGIQSEDVLWARRLPGKLAPESSGKLISETIIRLWEETP